MRAFAYPRLWLAGWLLGLVALLWTSLAPMPVLVPVAHGDKWAHLLSYALLSAYAGALFAGWRARIGAALGLVLLGVAIEWLQGLTAYRFADACDALANGFGAMLGMALSATALGTLLQRLDRWLARA